MRKNILFIMCDQLRAIISPAMDIRFPLNAQHRPTCRGGVRFSNAYCQAPLCGPSEPVFTQGVTLLHTELWPTQTR
ncbi:MAG: hypothetical protein Ct9H300mP21_06350 [Pseudomonadota bacterium]|nr:MAG: hypothetical protein Ct9H300mP21_06350 [Pseudomonadota bacterium]